MELHNIPPSILLWPFLVLDLLCSNCQLVPFYFLNHLLISTLRYIFIFSGHPIAPLADASQDNDVSRRMCSWLAYVVRYTFIDDDCRNIFRRLLSTIEADPWALVGCFHEGMAGENACVRRCSHYI